MWLATIASEVRGSVHDLATHGELLHQLVLRDVRVRYKQAVLGLGWAVLTPLLVVLSGVVIRTALLRSTSASLDGAVLATMGLKAVAWSFVVGAITFGTASLVSNLNLITKVYFPREVLPVAAVLASGFDLAIGLGVVLLALPLLGVMPHLQMLWLPVMLAGLVALTAGLVLLLSSANIFFRDVKYIVQVLLTFGIFFTPVLYEVASLGPRLGGLIMVNPLSPILEGLRLAVVERHNLLLPAPEHLWAPWHLAYGLGTAALALFVGTTSFRRAAGTFAEYA
jgi:ABC-type polysaccharide/polyol phosphate export permease